MEIIGGIFMRHLYKSSALHKVTQQYRKVCQKHTFFFFFFGCQSQRLCMLSFDFHIKTENESVNCTVVSKNWESIFCKDNGFQIS